MLDDFEVTLIGPIPSSWKVVELGNLTHLETGKRMKGGALNSGEVLSIGGEHITDSGNIRTDIPRYVTQEFYDALTQGKVQPGDVLLVKDGATTGKLAFIHNLPVPAMSINEHVFIIRSNNTNELDNEFLFYCLLSDYGQIQIQQQYHGLIGGVNRGEVRGMLIPLPPLPEQRAIAHILTTVRQSIEATERVIAAGRELKRSLMKYLFTYGPVPIDQADQVVGKQTEIGWIPQNWDVERIIDIASVNELSRNPTVKPEDYFYYVDISSVESGTGRITSPSLIQGKNAPSRARRVIQNDDVILSMVRPYLKAFAIVSKEFNHQICSTGFAVLTPSSSINSNFLYSAISSDIIGAQFIRHMKGASYPALNQGDVETTLIPVPPLVDQDKIGSYLQMIDKKVSIETKRNDALVVLFNSLLHHLMTGKLRVDPSIFQP